ncbi:MAG: hypothetical protein OWR52_10245 [Acidibacillus sp.]|nr:hypothetical protein [Acidibacillus sp.]
MRKVMRRLDHFAAMISILLLIQFVVGMMMNLYVAIPTVIPGTQSLPYWGKLLIALNWSLSFSNPILEGHSGLGVLLIALSMIFLYRAHRSHSAKWIIIGWLGVVSFLFSSLNGLLFLLDGQKAVNSLYMAIGFVISLFIYGLGVFMQSSA